MEGDELLTERDGARLLGSMTRAISEARGLCSLSAIVIDRKRVLVLGVSVTLLPCPPPLSRAGPSASASTPPCPSTRPPRPRHLLAHQPSPPSAPPTTASYRQPRSSEATMPRSPSSAFTGSTAPPTDPSTCPRTDRLHPTRPRPGALPPGPRRRRRVRRRCQHTALALPCATHRQRKLAAVVNDAAWLDLRLCCMAYDGSNTAAVVPNVPRGHTPRLLLPGGVRRLRCPPPCDLTVSSSIIGSDAFLVTSNAASASQRPLSGTILRFARRRIMMGAAMQAGLRL